MPNSSAASGVWTRPNVGQRAGARHNRGLGIIRVAINNPTGDRDRPVGRHAQDEDELFQVRAKVLGVGFTLHHFRSRLPAEVRITDSAHPLAGQVLPGRHVYRRAGQIYVVVVLPDSTVTSVPVESTDLSEAPVPSPSSTGLTTLSLAGARGLLALLEHLEERE